MSVPEICVCGARMNTDAMDSISVVCMCIHVCCIHRLGLGLGLGLGLYTSKFLINQRITFRTAKEESYPSHLYLFASILNVLVNWLSAALDIL